MKIEMNQYLTNVKPLMRELLSVLLNEYEFVSILAIKSKGKNYRVSKSGTTIAEDTMLGGQGFVIRIYDKKEFLEYSFNQLNQESLHLIPIKIKEQLITLSQQNSSLYKTKQYTPFQEDPCSFIKSSDCEIDPERYGDNKIIEFLTDIHLKGMQYNKDILDCTCVFKYLKTHKIYLSKNKDLEQNLLWSTGLIQGIAAKNSSNKFYHHSYSNLGGSELLASMNEDVGAIMQTALDLLNSGTITPGEYDVICTPEVTGIIVHEAFGHGVEMDMFVKNRALAAEFIDQYVASPLVTMHDGAAAPYIESGSYFFDDEGNPAKDTIIIDKGILKTGISDLQSALHLNTVPTGNGRRESYERKAYARMTNTYFEPGDSSVDEMIASIEYGFLLDNALSGMEDPKNWGIQIMVNIAKEIKDGKFTGRIFSPIVVTGYVPDLLKSISMISNECHLSGSGFCGKGYKEWVKVSDGGPAIKAKARLG